MRFVFAFLLIAGAAWSQAKVVSLHVVPAQTTLRGAQASQQFLAIAKYADGQERDVTGKVEWSLSDPGYGGVRFCRARESFRGRISQGDGGVLGAQSAVICTNRTG